MSIPSVDKFLPEFDVGIECEEAEDGLMELDIPGEFPFPSLLISTFLEFREESESEGFRMCFSIFRVRVVGSEMAGDL